MKAIETLYKGYRFRSRLEARWAVYFDAIGLKWEYEPEGFEFKDGTRYLPDFRLPEVGKWAEVKPEPLTREESRKVLLLARHTENFVLALVGTPAVHPYEALLACPIPEGAFVHDGVWDPEIPREQFLDSGIDDRHGTGLNVLWYLNGMPVWLDGKKLPSGSVILTQSSWSATHVTNQEDYETLISYEGVHILKIQRAVEAARSARFEFGETG